jgi:hypothetical protein
LKELRQGWIFRVFIFGGRVMSVLANLMSHLMSREQKISIFSDFFALFIWKKVDKNLFKNSNFQVTNWHQLFSKSKIATTNERYGNLLYMGATHD